MQVFRLEYRKNFEDEIGTGFYVNEYAPYVMENVGLTVNPSSRHPHICDEGVNIYSVVEQMNSAVYFGFESVEMMLRWFSAENLLSVEQSYTEIVDEIPSAGVILGELYVSVYEVPEVVSSQTQTLFPIESARLIESSSISDFITQLWYPEDESIAA